MTGRGALGFGVLDDLGGSGKRRGLRGHLGALRHGEVTTGTVKLAGLAATGLAGGLLLGGKPSDVVINAGLDRGRREPAQPLRPAPRPRHQGRGAVRRADRRGRRGDRGPTGAAGLAAVAAPLGAGLALLPEDLGERAMLGDAGANALGAMLGAAAAQALPQARAGSGCWPGIVALTVASEKVSFTKVIERTPALRRLDMLGRRPAPVGPAPADVAPVVIPAPGDGAAVAPAPGRSGRGGGALAAGPKNRTASAGRVRGKPRSFHQPVF